jgi:hypothetical protein
MSIRQLLASLPSLVPVLDTLVAAEDVELLDLPEGSGCGEECVKVLRQGAALIELLPDVAVLDPSLIESIHHALLRQVRVFYYG